MTKRGQKKAALILYEVIKAYSPAFYDIMGYDFSGRRQILIENFIEEADYDPIVEEVYGEALTEFCKSFKKGKIIQELKFGLLVNKILDDLDIRINSKKLREEIDDSVIRIARASKGLYRAHVRSLDSTDIIEKKPKKAKKK